MAANLGYGGGMQDAVLNALWPRYAKSSPKLFGRIGRVLHWILTVAAFGLAIGWLGNWLIGHSEQAAVCALLLPPVFAAGRGLRYILSGE